MDGVGDGWMRGREEEKVVERERKRGWRACSASGERTSECGSALTKSISISTYWSLENHSATMIPCQRLKEGDCALHAPATATAPDSVPAASASVPASSESAPVHGPTAARLMPSTRASGTGFAAATAAVSGAGTTTAAAAVAAAVAVAVGDRGLVVGGRRRANGNAPAEEGACANATMNATATATTTATAAAVAAAGAVFGAAPGRGGLVATAASAAMSMPRLTAHIWLAGSPAPGCGCMQSVRVQQHQKYHLQ